MYIDKDGNELEFDEAVEQLLLEHGYWEYEPAPAPADSAVRKRLRAAQKRVKERKARGMGACMAQRSFLSCLEGWLRDGTYDPLRLAEIEKWAKA